MKKITIKHKIEDFSNNIIPAFDSSIILPIIQLFKQKIFWLNPSLLSLINTSNQKTYSKSKKFSFRPNQNKIIAKK